MTLFTLTLLALMLATGAALALRAWLRPLRAAAQAVTGLRADLAQRVAELDELQRRSHHDVVTGLPLRHHFLVHLQQGLDDQGPGRAALVMLRVPQLEVLNLRLGREATDHLLRALGQLLLTYVERVPGAQAGRLNGSDFALFLPAVGVALQTAQSLRDALAALSALRSAAIVAVVGGVDGLPGISSGAALAEADAALARAESGEGDGLVVDSHGGLAAAAEGAGAWRAQIAAALQDGALRLETTPILDRHGHLVHLSCAPQLRLSSEAEYPPARLCLALAHRSRLLPPLERAALTAALQGIAYDGQARCVRMSAPSLQSAALVAEITAALRAQPAQSARLSIAMPSQPKPENQPALVAATAAWRLAGARVGVELANADPAALAALAQAGLGFVIVDAQQLRGVASDGSIRAYTRSLLTLVRSLGLATLAEGLIDGPDLAVAWSLGLDAATAPLPDTEELSAGEPVAETECAS